MSAADRDPRAVALGVSFDTGFADPPAAEPPPTVDLLQLTLGGERHAIVLGAVGSLHADLTVIPLPTTSPALLGVAVLRGTVTPIYDLALSVGQPASAVPPRWVVIARSQPVGFAFAELIGHARVEAARPVVNLIDLDLLVTRQGTS
jgi:chemotaxis signal transduction protein